MNLESKQQIRDNWDLFIVVQQARTDTRDQILETTQKAVREKQLKNADKIFENLWRLIDDYVNRIGYYAPGKPLRTAPGVTESSLIQFMGDAGTMSGDEQKHS